MADVAGLILALPGLLTSCVDCFNYMQLGRSFGSDYGKCLLALDATKLRLSRWGAAVGIGEDLTPAISLSPEEAELAQSLLESILDTFAKAEKTSSAFVKRALLKSQDKEALQVCEPQDLAPTYQNLHVTMQELAKKRQKKANILKKAKWAFYEKAKFDSMVADVRGFVDDLVELFPPGPKLEMSLQRQKDLSEAEVDEIKDNDELVLLKDAVGNSDVILQETTDLVLRSRGMGHIVENFTLSDSASVNIVDRNAPGRESNSHRVRGFHTSGNSVLNIGNNNY